MQTSKIYPWQIGQNFKNTKKIYPWQTSVLSDKQQEDLDRRLIEECQASHDNAKNIQALLKEGANNNYKPLYYAVENNKLNTARALLEGGPKFDYKSDLLQNAAKKGYLDMVKLLLKYGAKVDGNYGSYPLHSAVQSRHQDIVKLLLDNGAKVNSRDELCRHPLYYAAIMGQQRMVSLLLEYGATVFTEPLHAAIEHDHLEIVETLISHGVNVNSKNKFGSNALHVVTRCVNYGPEKRDRQLRIANIILDAGGVKVINEKDSESRTPIFLAAEQGNMNIVNFLLDRGADFKIKGNLDRTVLSQILRCGTNIATNIARNLIHKGARLSEGDVWKWNGARIKIEYATLLKGLGYLHPNFFGKDDYDPTKEKDIMKQMGVKQMGNVEIPTLSKLSVYALSKNPDARYPSQNVIAVNENGEVIDRRMITGNDLHLMYFLNSAIRADVKNLLGIETKQIPTIDIAKLIETRAKQEPESGTPISQRR